MSDWLRSPWGRCGYVDGDGIGSREGGNGYSGPPGSADGYGCAHGYAADGWGFGDVGIGQGDGDGDGVGGEDELA